MKKAYIYVKAHAPWALPLLATLGLKLSQTAQAWVKDPKHGVPEVAVLLIYSVVNALTPTANAQVANAQAVGDLPPATTTLQIPPAQ